MPSPHTAQPESLLGRTWPDRRLTAERRQVLDTRVDIDPTQAFLADADRRHADRRQYAARPVPVSGFGALS